MATKWNYCLCGRKYSTRVFKINHNKEIYLCPYCAYEILIQNVIYNYCPEYIKVLMKAIENRKWIYDMEKSKQ